MKKLIYTDEDMYSAYEIIDDIIIKIEHGYVDEEDSADVVFIEPKYLRRILEDYDLRNTIKKPFNSTKYEYKIGDSFTMGYIYQEITDIRKDINGNNEYQLNNNRWYNEWQITTWTD